MLNHSKLITDIQTKKAISLLTLILLVPLVTAHFKWLLTSSIGSLDEFWEKLFLHFIITSINILMLWWATSYVKKLRTPVLFTTANNNSDKTEFKLKYDITNRKMEIVNLISKGYTNKDIADELFISIDTVKDHNYNIFRKTDTKNHTQLANLFTTNN